MCWRALALSLTLLVRLSAGDEPIRVAVNPWTCVNPLLLAQDTDVEMIDLLFDRLVTIDAKGDFIPELLESWTLEKGGREVVLKLRPGLTWHDGHPIEAEDLLFTWRSLQLPRVRQIADTAPGVVSFDLLTVEDPLTVRIHLKRPRGTILSDLYNFIPVPRHCYQVGPKPLLDPVNLAPVGSGPYRVVGKVTARRMQLERWPGYRGVHPGQAPGFVLEDPGDVRALEQFQKNHLHFTGVGILRYYLVRKGVQGAGLAQAMSVPTASFSAYVLNCDPRKSLLGDRNLRLALAELVPWEEQAKTRRFFPVKLSSSFWPPESFAFDATPRPLPQVDRAAALLDAAGWRMGPDGLRHDAKGRPLTLVIYDVEQAIKLSVSHQLSIQAAKVGIRMEVRYVPVPELYRLGQEHQGDIWVYGWAFALDPDVDSPLLTREGYLTKANYSGYMNPEVDQLFDKGRHTLDVATRKRIYQQISDIIYRDKPIIPISFAQARLLVNRRLKGVDFNPLGQTYAFWPGRRGWRLEP